MVRSFRRNAEAPTTTKRAHARFITTKEIRTHAFTTPTSILLRHRLARKSTFTHILDQEGKTVFERDLPAGPEAFLSAIQLYRQGLVVGCECMFAWYWLADLCEDHELPFVLGHALYLLRGGIDAAQIRLALPQGPLVYLFDVDPKRPPNVDRLLRTNRRARQHGAWSAFSPDGSRLITVDVLGVVKPFGTWLTASPLADPLRNGAGS